eukprot:g24096.t1
MARKGLVCPPELSHNSNITLDLSIFVMPMLQFFSLPECCFDELEVPDWIFDTSHEPLFGKLKASESVEADDLIMQMTKTHTTPTTPPLAAKHPTVRHRFHPTKGYNFRGLNSTLVSQEISAIWSVHVACG